MVAFAALLILSVHADVVVAVVAPLTRPSPRLFWVSLLLKAAGEIRSSCFRRAANDATLLV